MSLSVMLKEIFPSKPTWNPDRDMPDQSGRVALVTGGIKAAFFGITVIAELISQLAIGNTGIGREIVKVFRSAGVSSRC